MLTDLQASGVTIGGTNFFFVKLSEILIPVVSSQ